jgi:hypothetical protein
MLSLQKHHITDLYVWVDEMLPKVSKPLGGRPPVLSDSEVITMLIWHTIVTKSKTFKDIYDWVDIYHSEEFPRLPSYQAFVDSCHRQAPLMLSLIEYLLVSDEPMRFMDSTMIEVCKLIRADSHKVAKKLAKFGKNHQGWHFGFKLHASINIKNQLSGLALTPADVYDAQMMPRILNEKTKIAVGDSHYGAKIMGRKIFENYGTIIVAPPHYTQKKKVVTWWQNLLLKMRPKIESVFGYLKERLNLVSSFPRSINGYLIHYLRILLSYQVMVL